MSTTRVERLSSTEGTRGKDDGAPAAPSGAPLGNTNAKSPSLQTQSEAPLPSTAEVKEDPPSTAPGAKETPPPTEAEARATAKAMAGLCMAQQDERGSWQCQRCPAWTSSPGDEPGFLLTGSRAGSFSARGRREMLLSLFGCEPRINGFGGTMLMVARGRTWRPHRYFPGFGWMRCETIDTKQGTARLVCLRQDSAPGTRFELVQVVDFATRESVQLLVATDTDSPGNDCRDWLAIDDFSVSDKNGDGLPDVVVSIRHDPTGKCLTEKSRGVATRLTFLALDRRFGFAPDRESAAVLAHGARTKLADGKPSDSDNLKGEGEILPVELESSSIP